jgi:hypothetical protein
VPFSAAEATQSQLEVSTFNPDGLAVEQSIGHFLSCRSQNALESGAGDAHFLGPLFLLQSFQIFQSQRLGLVDGQTDLFQNSHGDASRLEVGH